MLLGKKIAVVLPAHNEADYIERTILSLPKWVDQIVVVDDGSCDQTYFRASSLLEKCLPIVICRHKIRKGVGFAVMTGYKQAVVSGMDIAVTMDADGQMDPGHLRSMIRPLVSGCSDYVKGNRLYCLKVLKTMPFHRLAANLAFTFLTMLASGYWKIWDSQSGYTGLNLQFMNRMELNQIYGRFGFYNDFLIHLSRNGAKVKNVPVHAIYQGECSDICAWKDVPRIAWILLSGIKVRLKEIVMRQLSLRRDFGPA